MKRPDAPPPPEGLPTAPGQRTRAVLTEVFRRLYESFGPQHWWPAETRFEMIIGAILTQSAAWTNVEKAIANLKEAQVLEPAALRRMPISQLARLVHPSGYFNTKARKIKAFVEYLGQRYGDDLNALFTQDIAALRTDLLSIYGIGEETADSIVLYAAHRPAFVIDAYTRRIISRIGLAPDEDSYGTYQLIFTEHLPPDPELFNEYHALLVAHGKNICRKKPLCSKCCLNSLCAYCQQQGQVN